MLRKIRPSTATILGIIVVSGCSTSESTLRIEALPKGQFSELRTMPFAIYWRDGSDGHVYRSKLDGTGRELVIALDKTKGGAVKHGNFGFGSDVALVVDNYPCGTCSTILEPIRKRGSMLSGPVKLLGAPVPPTGMGAKTTGFQPLLGAGGKPSPWKIRYFVEKEPAGSKGCPSVTRLDFQKDSGRIVSYPIVNQGWYEMILDNGMVIMRGGEGTVLWNLNDDRRYLLANRSGIVWPRDLNKPERFKPVARGMARLRELQSPYDLPKDADIMAWIFAR